MTDREFIKLNTSIQTGSNANTIKEEDDGTIPAVIELRLPDNLFTPQVAYKKVDTVSMLTTKLRLSMSETPIAQLPLDMTLSDLDNNKMISSCQLDVYPYCLVGGKLQPDPAINPDLSLPSYKNHTLSCRFILVDPSDPESGEVLATYSGKANTQGLNLSDVLLNTPYYEVYMVSDVYKMQTHPMNLMVDPDNTEYEVENGYVYLKHVTLLEKILQDALENAITFALTSDIQSFDIYVISTDNIPVNIDPKPNTSALVKGQNLCYWKTVWDQEHSSITTDLLAACKPTVHFNDQSLSISYDSAAFKDIIPIIWNEAFVDTYDHPIQMTLDQFRKNIWSKPPPKRTYKYNALIDDQNKTYDFAVIEGLKCLVMNIIANKTMKDVFSFLPWFPVDTGKLPDFTPPEEIVTYKISVDKSYSDAQQRTCEENLVESVPFTRYMAKGITKDWSIPSVSPYHSYVDLADVFPDDACYMAFFYTVAEGSEDITDNRRQKAFVVGSYVGNSSLFTGAHYLLQGDFSDWSSATPSDSEHVVDYTTTTPQTVGVQTLEVGETTNVIHEDLGRTNTFTQCYAYRFKGNDWYINTSSEDWHNWISPSEMGVSNNYFNYTYPSKTPDVQWSSDPISGTVYHVWGWRTAWTGNAQIYEKYDSTTERNIIPYTHVEKKETYTVTQTTTIDSIAPPVDVGVTSKVLPNLSMDDKHFYILDGTNALVTVGEQELVQTIRTDYAFNVEERKHYDSQQRFTRTMGYYATTPSFIDMGGEIHLARADIQYYVLPLIDYDFYGEIMHMLYYVAHIPRSATYETWVEVFGLVSNDRADDYQALYVKNSYQHAGAELNTEPIYFDESYTPPVSMDPPDDEVVTYSSNDPSLTPGSTSVTSTSTKVTALWCDPYQVDAYAQVKNKAGVWKRASYGYGHYQKWICDQRLPDRGYAVKRQNCFIPGWDPMEFEYVDLNNANYKFVEFYWELAYDQVNFRGVGLDRADAFFVPSETRTYTESQITETTTVTPYSSDVIEQSGNIRLTFTWDNLPTVVMSPIQSFVLVLNGMNVSKEIHPINIAQAAGSSLTSTIPIIENYYSTATTLRDLHDELVVVRDSFSDAAFYKLDTTSGLERTLTLSVMYITKDGRLHQVYIPKNGVYTIQLTFGISYYLA